VSGGGRRWEGRDLNVWAEVGLLSGTTIVGLERWAYLAAVKSFFLPRFLWAEFVFHLKVYIEPDDETVKRRAEVQAVIDREWPAV
jgi:hypothetical protein